LIWSAGILPAQHAGETPALRFFSDFYFPDASDFAFSAPMKMLGYPVSSSQIATFSKGY
jgi:hypothetical protein